MTQWLDGFSARAEKRVALDAMGQPMDVLKARQVDGGIEVQAFLMDGEGNVIFGARDSQEVEAEPVVVTAFIRGGFIEDLEE